MPQPRTGLKPKCEIFWILPRPQKEISFSTHAMPPESVLALADELYGARPPAWILAIRGEAWEPNEPPTAAALSHFAAARDFLQAWLRRNLRRT